MKKFNLTEYWEYQDQKKENPSSKISYIINKEKRTVVALMDNCDYDAYEILEKTGLFSHLSCKQDSICNSLMMNSIYRGKAKCSPEDTWDEEEGKRIARNRMLQSYYKARTRVLVRAKKEFSNMLEDLSNRIDYGSNKLEKAWKFQL